MSFSSLPVRAAALLLALASATLGCQERSGEPIAPSEPSLEEFGRQAIGNLALKRGLIPGPLQEDPLSDWSLVDGAVGIINPDDYACGNDRPVWDWVNQEFNESLAVDFPEMFRLGEEFLAHQVPFVEARFVLTEDTPQSFGYDGEFTSVLQKTERGVKEFWDVFSDDIQLLALKGTMLQDEKRTAFVYQNFFSNDDGSPIMAEQAAEVAATVRTLLLQAETLDGGNHPMFSFNAATGYGPVGTPDRIMIGDAWLEGWPRTTSPTSAAPRSTSIAWPSSSASSSRSATASSPIPTTMAPHSSACGPRSSAST